MTIDTLDLMTFTTKNARITIGRKGLAALLERNDAPLHTCEPMPAYGCAAVVGGVKVRRIGSPKYFAVTRVMGDIVFTDDGSFRREYVREVRS